jgi:Tfp pilus assembly protein PilE
MASDCGKWNRGISLIDLVVILLVIGVLSAVAIPRMKGRADASKWSEGKATAVTVRTAADAYCKEKGKKFDFSGTALEDLGFTVNPKQPGGDLDGKYFTDDCYSIQFSGYADYLITVDATKSKSGNPPSKPRQMTLNNAGVFTEIP